MPRGVYYSEWDPFAAAWLRELMKDGQIPDGEIDTRSIADVTADDVRGFRQCHWFAGVGGWALAIRLAGWGDRPIWTGSCPCPPFSSAGKRKACPRCAGTNPVPHVGRTGYFVCCACEHEWLADSRHLWPELWRLIRDGRPDTFVGEQVSSEDGRVWLAAVRGSLEILGYAVGAGDLPAASVGAPHRRQRIYFVADTERAGVRDDGSRTDGAASSGVQGADGQRQRVRADAGECGSRDADAMADAERAERRPHDEHDEHESGRIETAGRSRRGGDAGDLADAEGRGLGIDGRASRDAGHVDERESAGRAEIASGAERGSWRAGCDGANSTGPHGEPAGSSAARRLGNARLTGLEGLGGHGDRGDEPGRDDADATGSTAAAGDSFWSDLVWLPCRDGKLRPAKPGIFPLASGVPNRVGTLRGAGNAIVPQVGAAFLRAYAAPVGEKP